MAAPAPEAAGMLIVVGVDASPASLRALDTVADLAALLGARLTALYVEEEELLAAAALPCVREVRLRSGTADPFSVETVERQWRAFSACVRERLHACAARHKAAWSFEVVRGRASSVLAEATGEAQIVCLSASGWQREQVRLGSVARAVLEHGGATLMLVPAAPHAGERWVALADGSPAEAGVLALVRRLAAAGASPLVLAGAGRLGAVALELADLLAAGSVRLQALPADGTGVVLGAVAAARAAGLILSAASPCATETALYRLLERARAPVLLVR